MMQDVGNDFGAIMFMFGVLMLGHFYCLNLMLAILSDTVGSTLTGQNDEHLMRGRKYAITDGDITTYIEKQKRVNTVDFTKINLKNNLKSRCSLVNENMQQIFHDARLNQVLPPKLRSTEINFSENLILTLQQSSFSKHIKIDEDSSSGEEGEKFSIYQEYNSCDEIDDETGKITRSLGTVNIQAQSTNSLL